MPVGLNLARYSSRFTNGAWLKLNDAVVDLAGSTDSPTGRACRVIVTVDGTWQVVQLGIPEYEPNTAFTLSVWMKQESLPTSLFGVHIQENTAGTGVRIYYNPVAHTVGTAAVFGTSTLWSSPTGGVESLGDSWYRVWVRGTTPPTAGLALRILIAGIADVGNSFLLGGVTLYQGTQVDWVDTTSTAQGSLLLPTFPSIYHAERTSYPQNSPVIQLGGSYVFTSRPVGPPQRTFYLTFEAMRHFFNSDGTVDTESYPEFNLGTLEAFYEEVQLYASFKYVHPRYGQLICRFAKPLDIPRPELGGFSVVKGVQVELIEVP